MRLEWIVLANHAALGLRFLVYSFLYGPQGLIQSLILAASLTIIGVQTILMGLIADLIAANRSLIEDSLLRVRKLELRLGEKPDLEPGYQRAEPEGGGSEHDGSEHDERDAASR